MNRNKITISFIFFISALFLYTQGSVLAWTVSPVRYEIKAERGKEYTLTFSVLNESQLYQKRFEIHTDDWTIDKNNNFLRKAFNKEVNNKYSATSWVKVTPQQFVVPPGETKNIRFTISVPADIPSEGEYSSGIFVGERNIEKPPKGEKVVHIKQDTFIGVVLYVRIGAEKREISLKDLIVNSVPLPNGVNKVIVSPVYQNTGNIHSRGQIQVKLEPAAEVAQDKDTKKIEFKGGEAVVLRESELAFPVEIPQLLLANTEWQFTISTDFGHDIPVLVGTKKYKVPFIEIPKTTIKEEKKIKEGNKAEDLVKEKLEQKKKKK
ncbi:MAG: hypothetical protein A3B68_09680 [Candidatus Melainabacteria bacterium RIFCSPHIGHO2_02_FULL_34_12]|nr:MAG: hypothetical protein A3B68_09680 [Candidatus Melainabacteria bacterium RIFCSPHIGHO2_02_FULL_34_12]